MSLLMKGVNGVIRGITGLICRIHGAQFEKIPAHGPLIIVGNHINFLEVPLMYTHLQPRPLTGFAKQETWDNLFLAFLFDHWGAIALRRGEADVTAFQEALQALDANKIVVLSPEGTRSGHGRLQRAHAGVVILALRREDVPILPVVFYGNEQLKENLKHLRRTDFHVVVGDPFFVDPGDEKVTRTVRRQIVDEIMYQMAALLPPAYRGYYADLAHATAHYLRFLPGSQNNLARALG